MNEGLFELAEEDRNLNKLSAETFYNMFCREMDFEVNTSFSYIFENRRFEAFNGFLFKEIINSNVLNFFILSNDENHKRYIKDLEEFVKEICDLLNKEIEKFTSEDENCDSNDREEKKAEDAEKAGDSTRNQESPAVDFRTKYSEIYNSLIIPPYSDDRVWDIDLIDARLRNKLKIIKNINSECPSWAEFKMQNDEEKKKYIVNLLSFYNSNPTSRLTC